MTARANLYEKNGKYHVMLSWQQNGKRKQKSVATGIPVNGNNKRKAEARKKEISSEWESKNNNKNEEVLFADYLKTWVYASKKRVQPTTYDVYEHMLDKHLYPHFRNLGVELGDVTPAIINKFYALKETEGLSSNTIIKYHAVLRSALQQAFKTKQIPDNPCDFADKPKRTKYRGEFYNVVEIKALLELAKGTPLEVPIYLAAYFGLRRSEILGLKWDAIDFTNRTLSVKHKVVRMKEDGKMTEFATNDLKNESSYRVLPLDENIVAYLKNLKHQQDENRIRNGNCRFSEFDEYVCVNELGDRIKPDYVTNYFIKMIKRNNLKKIRFHDLSYQN